MLLVWGICLDRCLCGGFVVCVDWLCLLAGLVDVGLLYLPLVGCLLLLGGCGCLVCGCCFLVGLLLWWFNVSLQLWLF